ncbi:MAG: methyltransferase domain-containing protein, partial [Planctomycetota bacterium]|nr:methyltransferase domain-containing protein [Planctomycetota bacterium]
LKKIVRRDEGVFAVTGEGVDKVIRYCEQTRLTYKLRPTADWPALEISGILMHRVMATTPRADAQAKVALLAPLHGAVLETCMGLGYTAILSAATARAVTAIEKDPNVLAMARINPYSQELFDNPKITLIAGDAARVVSGFPRASFDVVNHDPPTLSVAGELYSDDFYGDLFRLLRPGGTLLHYTGAPGSRGRRVDLNASVSRRLTSIGFVNVRTDLQTSCILAARPARPA